MKNLIREIKACSICKEHLPYPPKPVCSFSEASKILIVGQAPGIRVHNSGIPWDDPSGHRLRKWLGVAKGDFYNTRNFAIVPMGFCYPGKGKSGDLPPRPECAAKWMQPILLQLQNRHLTILIGQYAHKYFLGERRKETLTQTVKNWEDYAPDYMVLPHPSPRNNIWLRKNPWFEQEMIGGLQQEVSRILI